MDTEINWKRLANAISFFTENGYRYVEVPWNVPTHVTRATCPEERRIVGSSIGDLVGSAEQSFMHLEGVGQLGKGAFVTCSPCFRNEDTVDVFHQRTFMKVELYQNVNVTRDELDRMVELVMEFNRTVLKSEFWSYLKRRDMAPHEIDIELSSIEIGSYGIRSMNGNDWIYGTGIAEPRFTTAVNFVKKHR